MPSESEPSASAPDAASRPLVVIVDDQSAGRRILEQLIRRIDPDLEVAAFASATEALAFIRGHPPDLIITDYLMPQLDGVGFIRTLRALPGLGDVPVIVVTVVEDREVRYRALDAGATDFLNRPIDEHECGARCRNLLRLHRQQQFIRQRARHLEASERRFRIMADELPLMIWGQDGDASVGFANRTCCAFFGLSEAELVGNGWQRLVHPDDRDAYVQALSAACRERRSFHGECRVRRADGEWRWMESFVRSFHLPDQGSDEGVHIVGASIDITERKAAEQALRLSHLELSRRGEQLARLTSQLTLTEQRERKRLAQVLHDELQQLLVGAAFGLERLGRRAARAAGAAEGGDEAIGVQVGQVAQLLQQAIAVARTLVADLSPPILHEAGLPEALEWLARRMRERYGLRVRLSLDRSVSPAGEDLRSLIFDAVREALLNVVKHAQCTEVELALTQDVAQRLVIRIADAGVGFDAQQIAEEAAGAGRGETGGPSGFGLFSMRERLNALGGSVGIDSAPGQGTEVVLRAPLTTPKQRRPAAAGPEAQAPNRASPETAAQDGTVRVLLVDDHTMVRRALASMLHGEQDLAIVGEAADGLDAIAAVERLAPNVVLMDCAMPGLDGLEATRRIKSRWPQVRVVGLSMYDEADRGAAMREAGADAYLSKTGDIDALLGAIRAGSEGRPSA